MKTRTHGRPDGFLVEWIYGSRQIKNSWKIKCIRCADHCTQVARIGDFLTYKIQIVAPHRIFSYISGDGTTIAMPCGFFVLPSRSNKASGMDRICVSLPNRKTPAPFGCGAWFFSSESRIICGTSPEISASSQRRTPSINTTPSRSAILLSMQRTRKAILRILFACNRTDILHTKFSEPLLPERRAQQSRSDP